MNSSKEELNIEKRFPSVVFMEEAARRRIPGFVLDFMERGMGEGIAVSKNRESLKQIELMPYYLADADKPRLRCKLFGREYDAPFGVAPMGMSSLIWPGLEATLAAAAKSHNIPYVLSTQGCITLERAREIAGENAWFQLLVPKETPIVHDLIKRCKNAGYDTMLVTVDTPFTARREHDIHNGLVPPNFGIDILWQILKRPRWAFKSMLQGVPQFANIMPYLGPGVKIRHMVHDSRFKEERTGSHVTAQRFADIRKLWPGKLLAKGVLSPEEAKSYIRLGADGIVVSNHGGRQLDAAPATAQVLPRIREAIGPDVPLLVDGGVRSGLDVARMLALGANFVLMGRPFLYAGAALESKGGDHVMNVLKGELQATMGQIGCATPEQLPAFLHTA